MAGAGILPRHIQAYQDLLYVTALRGPHSTGVYAARTLRNKLTDHLRKDDCDAAHFLYLHGHPRGFLSDMSVDLFMGHCRYATVGKVNKQNAHPFVVGSLVGAHNGTVRGKEFFSPNKTDSQMMFEKMESIGIKQTLETLTYWDAYAVSVFDKGSRTLTLARNTDRKLFLGIDKENDVIFWASEVQMLHLVAARNKIQLSCFALQPHTMYEIDLTKIQADNDKPYTTQEIKQDDYSLFGYSSDTNDRAPWI